MSYSRGAPNIDGMTSLKVDNLTYRTTPEDLKRVFEKYGDVGDVYIPRHPYTRESRGFAFVRFYDNRDAEDAMDSLDGYILDGRELRVQMARYGRPGDPRRGSRNRRRRSRSRSRSRSRRRSRSRSRYFFLNLFCFHVFASHIFNAAMFVLLLFWCLPPTPSAMFFCVFVLFMGKKEIFRISLYLLR